MSFNDPYQLVKQVCSPISKYIPKAIKFNNKGFAYGFAYGAFQTSCEIALFGQVVNYGFDKRRRSNVKSEWRLREIYKTYPKNLISLIPYYTTTRSLQFGINNIKNKNWLIRLLTPTLVLPYEHLFSGVIHNTFQSIPRPICSVYHNVLPFMLMEMIHEATMLLKPTMNNTLAFVMSSGWSKLTVSALANATGYFLNHPASVVNVYMKTHPTATFSQSIKTILSTKGIQGFYEGSIQRCTRAAHSAIVTSLAGVAFETLFVLPPPQKQKKQFFLI
ncbi:Mitochondrial carrier protein [Entamoeba marina]